MKNIILLLRPQQWVKNMFIFLPLFFHGDLTNVQMLTNAVIAFFCYSFAAISFFKPCVLDSWKLQYAGDWCYLLLLSDEYSLLCKA